MPLPIVECGECDSPQYSVIWLHGLGADGHDFVPIIKQLRLPANTHFVFPHAPVQPVTLNGGMSMRAWFDISSLDKDGPIDGDGLVQSVTAVTELIDAEVAKGVAAEHIIVAGFSQGGCVAIHTGLRYPQRLAGIIGLSTYVPMRTELQTAVHPANQATPLLMAHGDQDPVVQTVFGQNSADALREWGFDVTWHEYPMPHSVCAEEIDDIAHWLSHTALPELLVGKQG